jgi:hypothetical protein
VTGRTHAGCCWCRCHPGHLLLLLLPLSCLLLCCQLLCCPQLRCQTLWHKLPQELLRRLLLLLLLLLLNHVCGKIPAALLLLQGLPQH